MACGRFKKQSIVLQGKHKKKYFLYLKEKGYDISHLKDGLTKVYVGKNKCFFFKR